MDEIKTRLQETSENCFKAYEAWVGDKKNSALRETLQGTIHELRKVASRLEIDVAVSDRGNGSQKPMPIPSHRDSKPGGGGGNKNDAADNVGNTHNVADGLKPRKSGGGRGGRRRSGGGSGGNKA